MGFHLSEEGIQPQQGLTDAINSFTPPTNKKEVKRFLGLAGFYRHFIKDFARISKPLTRLTSDHVNFEWTDSESNAFETLKQKLSSAPVLAFPEFGAPFIVETDASDEAVGGVLSQYKSDGNIHPVGYFSNTLDACKQKWSTHTKEAYAVVAATRHWYVYLMGKPFTLFTDHNPLVYLCKQKDPRGKYARWIAELEELDYNIEYIPGGQNVKADALSRNTAGNALPEDKFDDKIYFLERADKHFLEQVRLEQNENETISILKRKLKENATIDQGRYKRVQKQLRIENGILTKSGRIVIPPCMRQHVTGIYHSTAHHGFEKLYPVLKERFYWPSMNVFIQNFINSCSTCQRCKADRVTPKAPLISTFIPEAPMQFVSMDIATLPTDEEGYKYIFLIGDVFSKYIVAEPMKDQLASTISDVIWQKWINVYGCPKYLLSDQGSNVDGETVRSLCEKLGIEKRRSSAYHSQGNGFAERNIRSIREILRTILHERRVSQKKWRKLLPEVVFSLNSTKSASTKYAPSELVFGRCPRLPEDIKLGVSRGNEETYTPVEYMTELKFKLKDILVQVSKFLRNSKDTMKRNYDKSVRLNEYSAGSQVWLRKKCYKTGENKKLSPRRTGPWTILKKFPNGVNFRIKRNGSSEEKVIHHDRLYPVKNARNLIDGEDENVSDDDVRFNVESSSSSNPSDNENEEVINNNNNNNNNQRNLRYPQRDRRPRIIPGAIPWNVIQI